MYEPQLRASPLDEGEWWQAVHNLVAGWYGLPTGAIGLPASDVVELSERLGRSLPQGVHEWSNLHRHLREHRAFERVMRDQYALGWDDRLDALTLLVQGEGDFYWGIDESQIGSSQPAVDGWRVDHEADVEAWLPAGRQHAHVAEFAFLHALAYVKGAGRVRGIVAPGPERAQLDRLLAAECSTRTTVGPLTVYEASDLIARIEDAPGPAGHHFAVTIGASLANDIPPAVRRIAEAASSLEGVFVPPDTQELFGLPGWTINATNPARRPLGAED